MSVRIYEVLEVLDQRHVRTGRYRMATYTTEFPEPVSLCTHRHQTPEEAVNCPSVRDIIDNEFVARQV